MRSREEVDVQISNMVEEILRSQGNLGSVSTGVSRMKTRRVGTEALLASPGPTCSWHGSRRHVIGCKPCRRRELFSYAAGRSLAIEHSPQNESTAVTEDSSGGFVLTKLVKGREEMYA